jgi:hypothetical protein
VLCTEKPNITVRNFIILRQIFWILTDLLLVPINFISLAACTLIRPDGTEVNLMDIPSDSPVYEGSAQIADNEPPGLLYTYKTDGIISFDPGTEHYYKTQEENC